MLEIRYTRNLFLRGICVVYLFAFVSFYIQIPGLYGNNGLLPAKSQLSGIQSAKSLSDKVHAKPTLLWFSSYLSLNTEYMLDVLSLLGIFFSFTGFITQKFCTCPTFAALWSLYFSLYQVGQTFLWFQWDILLLETGFLCIFLAPLTSQSTKSRLHTTSRDKVMFWMVRWLLFRLMFASGVVKLQSNCPTWWGLTALNVHFESQPLPTPLAWYSHHMPDWLLKLGTVHANVIEIILPLLFFVPVRSVRVVGFYNQLLLQLCIIFTGNYNFFNFMTIVLLLSLLDDEFFYPRPSSWSSTLVKLTVNLTLHGLVLYYTIVYYGITWDEKKGLQAKITFTRRQFDEFVNKTVPLAIYVGGVSLLILSFRAVVNTMSTKKSFVLKFTQLLVTLFYVTVAGFIFGVSLVPFSVLTPSFNSTIQPQLRNIYSRIDHLHIVNSYGLFRRMTGVGGRPEVIIEGSNNIEGPWIEYHFKYKPGDVNSSLPFVAPYQPRLDWQMWFASLGTYHQNPWIMSLAYRLLNGEPWVLNLLDQQKLPFTTPPKYIKASLYHYHYTRYNERHGKTWWRREKVGEYFPIFTKDHSPLVDYLKTMRIVDEDEGTRDSRDKHLSPILKSVLDQIRSVTYGVEPVVLVWSVFVTGCAIIVFTVRRPQRSAGRARK